MKIEVNLTRPQLEALFSASAVEYEKMRNPAGHPNDPDKVLGRAMLALANGQSHGGTIHDEMDWKALSLRWRKVMWQNLELKVTVHILSEGRPLCDFDDADPCDWDDGHAWCGIADARPAWKPGDNHVWCPGCKRVEKKL